MHLGVVHEIATRGQHPQINITQPTVTHYAARKIRKTDTIVTGYLNTLEITVFFRKILLILRF